MNIGNLVDPKDLMHISLETGTLSAAIIALQDKYGFRSIGEKREFCREEVGFSCILLHDGNEFRGVGRNMFSAYEDAYKQSMHYGV